MLLLARRPQPVLAPPLLLFVLASVGSARGDKPAPSGSSIADLPDPGTVLVIDGQATPTSYDDELGFSPVSFVEHVESTALARHPPAQTAPSLTSHNRMPFHLDFTTFHRRWARSSEASNTPKTIVSTAASDVVNSTRRIRRDEPDPCYKFQEGDPTKQEFYSPGYPEAYPKNISCFKVLQAEPGMVLEVEFRDHFELEDHEKCSYDYLEVRDGKYGYSKLIGKYCRAFPFPIIRSSTRYLWLHFHSDNSIQGTGFRAVWSMVKNQEKTPEVEECMLNVTNYMEYEINTTAIADRKKLASEQGTELDCIWNITVPDGYKIQLTFPGFHLDKPNECDINFVEVYDKEPSSINNPTCINNFCGSIAELVLSKGNEAYLRFFVTKAAINSSFEALMTAVREKENKDKSCNDNEFDCQDACISGELKCNGRNNCRYRFDEDADVCSTEKAGLNMQSEHVIIILVVFSLLMSGLCGTFFYNCINKLVRDHKIIKEHIRQSRENRLDELGRKATPCSIQEPCSELMEKIVASDHHRHSSESPSLEMLSNPRELISRDYSRERSIQLSVDINDIHQSNNVSNATQERLRVSSEERQTRDMECQTRESIFDSGFILKPSAHPAFTTFGFQTTPTGSRKQSLDYHPSHHYHHHPHPHYHPQPYNQYHHHPHHYQPKSSPPSDKVEKSPASRRCSVCHPSAEPSTTPNLCLRHSTTPIVPAPHGWSAHESMYEPTDLASLQRILDASPTKTAESDASRERSDSAGKPSPHFVLHQRNIGSGENYGFIYGHDEKDPSEHTAGSSSTGSARSAAAKPVKCPQVLDSRFKTEAVIEVDQKRPFSIESTKSAPDVIATH